MKSHNGRPTAFLAITLLFAVVLPGCQAQVHPRVGQGMPTPTWVEVQPPDPIDPQGQGGSATADIGPMKVHARHLLVAYRGAMRASPAIGRTRDEAFLRANDALRRAQAGDDFEGLVAEYSDEPGAAARGGDLGEFTRGQMVQAFSDAAFSLKVGEISDIVETPFGFHIIQRLN